jgi:hypothetical protein
MSEALVKFLTLEGDPCPPDQKPARFTFRCVGYNRGKDQRLPPTKCANLLLADGPHTTHHGIKRDGQGQNGGRPQWDWDGNRDAPTMHPSINCGGHCGWHGYIRKGRCEEPDGQESV